jgi:hypothetical protein
MVGGFQGFDRVSYQAGLIDSGSHHNYTRLHQDHLLDPVDPVALVALPYKQLAALVLAEMECLAHPIAAHGVKTNSRMALRRLSDY